MARAKRKAPVGPVLFSSVLLRQIRAMDGFHGHDRIWNDIAQYLDAFDANPELTTTLNFTSGSIAINKFVSLLHNCVARVQIEKTLDEDRFGLCLDVIELLCEIPQEHMEANAFQILAESGGPALLSIVLQPDLNIGWRFCYQIAEALTLLLETAISRFAEVPLSLEACLGFILQGSNPSELGSMIARCGNYLIQGNIVELVVKVLGGLHACGAHKRADKMGLKFSWGVLTNPKGDVIQSASTVNSCADVLQSIIRDDHNGRSLVSRIRQWLNMTNESLIKTASCTVFSYRAQKVLVNDEDRSCSVEAMWVDFNRSCLMVNAPYASATDGSIHPLLIAVPYSSIITARGRVSSSSVTISVNHLLDLIKDIEIAELITLVFEFNRSDFPAVGNTLKNMGIAFNIAKRPAPNTNDKDCDFMAKRTATHRKSSVAVCLLEQFLNTDPSKSLLCVSKPFMRSCISKPSITTHDESSTDVANTDIPETGGNRIPSGDLLLPSPFSSAVVPSKQFVPSEPQEHSCADADFLAILKQHELNLSHKWIAMYKSMQQVSADAIIMIKEASDQLQENMKKDLEEVMIHLRSDLLNLQFGAELTQRLRR